MIVITDKSYLVSAKIDLGKFFDRPAGEVYLEIREPSTFDAVKLEKATKQQDQAEFMKVLYDLLPNLITGHSFYLNEQTRMPNKEVVDLLESKPSIFIHVCTEYARMVTFTLGKKSEGK